MHLPDAANRDHDRTVIGPAEPIDRVDIRYFLEQFGFGIRARLVQARCRNLEMEMPGCSISVGVSPLDEERRCLQASDCGTKGRHGLTRDADGQIRAQVRHQVVSHLVGVWESRKGNQGQTRTLNRSQSKNDHPMLGDGNAAAIRQYLRHPRDALVCGCHQSADMAIGHNHEALLHIVAARLELGGSGCCYQQWHGAKLIEWEESCSWWTPLDS